MTLSYRKCKSSRYKILESFSYHFLVKDNFLNFSNLLSLFVEQIVTVDVDLERNMI